MVMRLKKGINNGMKTRKIRNRWILMNAWEDMDSIKRISGIIDD